LSQKIADFTNSETFKKMLEWLEEKMDSTTPEDIAKGIETIAKAFIFFKIVSLGLKALTSLTPAVTTIKSLIDIFKGGAGTAAAGAGAKGLAASLSGAYASLGGLSGILTTDLATIFGAGTAAEIGTTLGVGVAGAFMAAIGGFELGKWLGAQIFPEMEEEYKNFHWLGEGGFFDQMKGSINDGSFIGALELWRQDIESWLDENIGEWSSLTWSELFGVKEEEITKAAQSVQGALGGIVTTGLTMSQTLSDTTGKTKEMTDGVSELSTGLSNGKTSLDNYQQGLSDASGTGQEFVNSLDNAFTGMEGFNENAVTAGLNAGLSLAKGLQDSKADISTSIAGLSTQIETEGSAMEQQTTVLGGSLIAGFNNGITNNMETTTASLDSWSDAIIKAIHDGPLKFGSPSKKTEEFGKDTVEGYNNGVSRNVTRTIVVIKSYMQTIQSTFMQLVGMMSDVGQKAMSALIETLISKQSELKAIVESIVGLVGSAAAAASKINTSVNSATLGAKQFSLPQLTSSSVVRGGNPYGAMLSMQSRSSSGQGLSVENIEKAMERVMSKNGGGEYTFVAQLNGKVLYSETVRQDQMIKKSAGKSRLGN